MLGNLSIFQAIVISGMRNAIPARIICLENLSIFQPNEFGTWTGMHRMLGNLSISQPFLPMQRADVRWTVSGMLGNLSIFQPNVNISTGIAIGIHSLQAIRIHFG